MTALLGDDLCARRALHCGMRACSLTRARVRRSTIGAVLSSASSSVNGQKRVELRCALADAGVATLRGESRGQGGELQLVSLQVSAAGQVIDVSVAGRGGDGDGDGGGRGSAEVIDVDSR